LFSEDLESPISVLYAYSGFRLEFGTERTPFCSLIFPISSIFGDLKPLEKFPLIFQFFSALNT